MRILFVAVFKPGSTNVSQAKALARAGHEVIEYDYREELDSPWHGDIPARDGDLADLIHRGRPELTIFSKCNKMGNKPIVAASVVGKSCMWYMDPMGNLNQEFIEKMERATYSCFALTTPYLAAIDIIGPDRTFFVHEGFDADIDKPVENAEIVHEVSFIGNLRNATRQRYCQELGIHNFTNAYGMAHPIAVAQSKINLNFTDGGTSDRTYKVLAARGFLLTQPWPGMNEDGFVDGINLATFNSFTHCREQIRLYLRRDGPRRRIAQNGYDLVTKSYSRDKWAENIVAISEQFSR